MTFFLKFLIWGEKAVASLTVPGGQEFHFPHFFLKFWLVFLIFPQTLLFFLILTFWVGEPGKAMAMPLGENVSNKWNYALVATDENGNPWINY